MLGNTDAFTTRGHDLAQVGYGRVIGDFRYTVNEPRRNFDFQLAVESPLVINFPSTAPIFCLAQRVGEILSYSRGPLLAGAAVMLAFAGVAAASLYAPESGASFGVDSEDPEVNDSFWPGSTTCGFPIPALKDHIFGQ